MGETQLHYASSYKGAAKRRNQPNDNSGAEMVKMLLDAGADVSSGSGTTPIRPASTNPNI